jgi:hypothetical protein
MHTQGTFLAGGLLLAALSVASPARAQAVNVSAIDYFVPHVMLTPQPHPATGRSSAPDPMGPTAVDQFAERVMLGRTGTAAAVEVGQSASNGDEAVYSGPDFRFMYGSTR